MNSTETSPSWAAESTAELPLMPTWPGTQIKTISLPSLDKFIYNSRIWPKIGWSNFRLNIAVKDDKESDSIKNDFLLEQWIYFRTKRTAWNYAVYMELSSGRWQVKGFLEHFVETAAAVTPASVLEPSMKNIFRRRIFSNELQIKMFIRFPVSCLLWIWLNHDGLQSWKIPRGSFSKSERGLCVTTRYNVTEALSKQHLPYFLNGGETETTNCKICFRTVSWFL